MRDHSVLLDPLTNKGTAFTIEERAELGLVGILPEAVETIDQQLQREYQAFRSRPTALDKHLMLRGLQDRNEVLFYRLAADHLAEMLPIIYTPTVAEACRSFSHTYQRPRGLFLSYPARRRMREALRNRPRDEVDVIVVTDGERILGIGDQGVGGMGIPIGKLSLYTAIGGIDPARTLPIVLDVGTNDPARLADPGYLGWRHPRVTGAEYHRFVADFVAAVQDELPGVLLQWEDFAIDHAEPILAEFRDRLLTFNDDIQGTAAVVLATVLRACGVSGTPIHEQRIVLLGAGSAAIGVARYLRAAMIEHSLSPAAAARRIALVDKFGLVHQDRADLSPAQREFARPPADATDWASDQGGANLASVVERFRPTTLIGLSTAGGAFTEPIVRQMARNAPRPIILPLSNPSSCSEADPRDVLTWTDGRALVATGSPFPPATTVDGPVAISQCNNAFIFPAVGLAVIAAGATRVTETMFAAAASALARLAGAGRPVSAGLLPPVGDLADLAPRIALDVAVRAVADGVAPHRSPGELADRIEQVRWRPGYRPGPEARDHAGVELDGDRPVRVVA
ncbi:NAD-dependent malic enzyme [Nakamurella sp.]|uniref:NAD-dependent malic enzyme n=1 Tax=Nakamurella sp. TaxID=1869182 RepID=UPI003784798E